MAFHVHSRGRKISINKEFASQKDLRLLIDYCLHSVILLPMTVITIPKHMHHKDLVLIPKEEYEELKRAELPRAFKEVSMTKAQKRAFERAERNFAEGNTLTLDEFRQKLGFAR